MAAPHYDCNTLLWALKYKKDTTGRMFIVQADQLKMFNGPLGRSCVMPPDTYWGIQITNNSTDKRAFIIEMGDCIIQSQKNTPPVDPRTVSPFTWIPGKQHHLNSPSYILLGQWVDTQNKILQPFLSNAPPKHTINGPISTLHPGSIRISFYNNIGESQHTKLPSTPTTKKYTYTSTRRKQHKKFAHSLVLQLGTPMKFTATDHIHRTRYTSKKTLVPFKQQLRAKIACLQPIHPTQYKSSPDGTKIACLHGTKITQDRSSPDGTLTIHFVTHRYQQLQRTHKAQLQQ